MLCLAKMLRRGGVACNELPLHVSMGVAILLIIILLHATNLYEFSLFQFSWKKHIGDGVKVKTIILFHNVVCSKQQIVRQVYINKYNNFFLLFEWQTKI